MQTIKISRDFNFIVGPTVSGKTYFTQKVKETFKNVDFNIITLDDFVEEAARLGKHNEYYNLYTKTLLKALDEDKPILMDTAYVLAPQVIALIYAIREIGNYDGTINIIKFNIPKDVCLQFLQKRKIRPTMESFEIQRFQYHFVDGSLDFDFGMMYPNIKEEIVTDENYNLVLE